MNSSGSKMLNVKCAVANEAYRLDAHLPSSGREPMGG